MNKYLHFLIFSDYFLLQCRKVCRFLSSFFLQEFSIVSFRPLFALFRDTSSAFQITLCAIRGSFIDNKFVALII